MYVHYTGLGPLLRRTNVPFPKARPTWSFHLCGLPNNAVTGGWRVGKGRSRRVWACLRKWESLVSAESLTQVPQVTELSKQHLPCGKKAVTKDKLLTDTPGLKEGQVGSVTFRPSP